ncbi:hypothetical protein RUND412_001004 [Rhizina undulata]
MEDTNCCPICMLPLTSAVKLNCGHIFCRACIHRWLNHKLPAHDLQSREHHAELLLSRFNPESNSDMKEVLKYSEMITPPEARIRFQRRFVAIYLQDVRRDMGLPPNEKLAAEINGIADVKGEAQGEFDFDSVARLELAEKRGVSEDMVCPMCRQMLRTVRTISPDCSDIQEMPEILDELRPVFNSNRLWRNFITGVWVQAPRRLPERARGFLEPLMSEINKPTPLPPAFRIHMGY